MRRAPRRSFAAPLVVTLAIAPVAACTVDHRTTTPTPVADPTPDRDHRGDPNTPPATATQGSWTITMNGDGSCQAMAQVSCPAGTMCNPPPPAQYACPEGITADRPMTIQQDGDHCQLLPATPLCAPNTMCNPPPARDVACPHY